MWLEQKQQHLCSRRRTPGEASPWAAPSEQHRHAGLALEHLSLHFGAVRYFCSSMATVTSLPMASSTGGPTAGQPWPGDTCGACPCKGSGAKILICVTAQVPGVHQDTHPGQHRHRQDPQGHINVTPAQGHTKPAAEPRQTIPPSLIIFQDT